MRLIFILLFVITASGLVIWFGCNLPSAVARRQKLVEQFHTVEVSAVPGGSAVSFIVRDTNGAVWYVDYGAMTKIFGGVEK